MTDYTKLVAALRCCVADSDGYINCKGNKCPLFGTGIDCESVLHTDAADAIEALQKAKAIANRKLDSALKRMPKRGEWVELGYQPNVHETRYRCSLCGRQVLILSGSGELLKTYPYCHCGAKMEVQDDRK